MSATTTARVQIKAVTMPAGKYWVGDPCYGVPDDLWMTWLKAADYENRDVLIADLDGYPVLGIGTAHGDGEYEGNDGNRYPVDAGLIGCVPAEIVDADPILTAPFGMQLVEFTEPFDCESDDGLISIGHIDIDTDPDEEPEWEDEPEDDIDDEDEED